MSEVSARHWHHLHKHTPGVDLEVVDGRYFHSLGHDDMPSVHYSSVSQFKRFAHIL